MKRRQLVIAENVAELMRFGKPRAKERDMVNLLVLA